MHAKFVNGVVEGYSIPFPRVWLPSIGSGLQDDDGQEIMVGRYAESDGELAGTEWFPVVEVNNPIPPEYHVADGKTCEVQGDIAVLTYKFKPMSADQIERVLDGAVIAHLDRAARSRKWSTMAILLAQANSTNAAWRAEAASGQMLYDGCYAVFIQTVADMAAGRTPPTIAEFTASLPAITWPVEG